MHGCNPHASAFGDPAHDSKPPARPDPRCRPRLPSLCQQPGDHAGERVKRTCTYLITAPRYLCACRNTAGAQALLSFFSVFFFANITSCYLFSGHWHNIRKQNHYYPPCAPPRRFSSACPYSSLRPPDCIRYITSSPAGTTCQRWFRYGDYRTLSGCHEGSRCIRPDRPWSRSSATAGPQGERTRGDWRTTRCSRP
jgi:hypothetical protein